MRRLVVNTFVTLDDIMQAPGGDELRIWIFPVVIGTGKRLFGEGTTPSSFKFIDSKTSGTGVILATYEPSGELMTASFALDSPSEAELACRKQMREMN